MGFCVERTTMLGKLFPLAAGAVLLALPAEAFTGTEDGTRSLFITKDFVHIRQGPGTNSPLIGAIPPAARVNVDHCSVRWSPGWCKVTYEGTTGYAHSSLLQPLPSAVKVRPKFLLQARNAYKQAQSALEAAKQNLNQVLQTEAQRSRLAMAKAGSWIEPQALWQKKRTAEQNLAFAQEQERQARARLDNAEDQARAIWEAKWTYTRQPSRPSWWQWW
jgi:Bacterial SH3 domain